MEELALGPLPLHMQQHRRLNTFRILILPFLSCVRLCRPRRRVFYARRRGRDAAQHGAQARHDSAALARKVGAAAAQHDTGHDEDVVHDEADIDEQDDQAKGSLALRLGSSREGEHHHE